MRIIDLLASQLDREVKDFELQATQKVFTESLEFWQLCLEAKRLLLDEQLAKEDKNAFDKQ